MSGFGVAQRVDHIYEDPHIDNRRFSLHYGDLTDSTNLIRIIQEVQPDEIYNLAAQSHVAVSFEEPEYTANADGIVAIRIMRRSETAATEASVGEAASFPCCSRCRRLRPYPKQTAVSDRGYRIRLRLRVDADERTMRRRLRFEIAHETVFRANLNMPGGLARAVNQH